MTLPSVLLCAAALQAGPSEKQLQNRAVVEDAAAVCHADRYGPYFRDPGARILVVELRKFSQIKKKVSWRSPPSPAKATLEVLEQLSDPVGIGGPPWRTPAGPEMLELKWYPLSRKTVKEKKGSLVMAKTGQRLIVVVGVGPGVMKPACRLVDSELNRAWIMKARPLILSGCAFDRLEPAGG